MRLHAPHLHPAKALHLLQAQHMSESLKVSFKRLHMPADVLCCGTKLVVVMFQTLVVTGTSELR